MSVDWNKPIETVPCERNPNPVPCEFGGFFGDLTARVWIRGSWLDPKGNNMEDFGDDGAWFCDRISGEILGTFLPKIRNVTPTTKPEPTPTKTLRDEFAMAVIGSVVIATSAGQHQPIRADGISLIDAMARDAYQIADAMMAEKAMMNARKEMGDD